MKKEKNMFDSFVRFFSFAFGTKEGMKEGMCACGMVWKNNEELDRVVGRNPKGSHPYPKKKHKHTHTHTHTLSTPKITKKKMNIIQEKK
jgi:Zn-finger nucleic acid-binding protein